MEPCDKCGGYFEELFGQPDGKYYCRGCHLGLLQEMTDEEYNRLRGEYDRDAEFKALRHRFWMLGVARRGIVLNEIGYCSPGEVPVEKIVRFKLYKIKEAGLQDRLAELIGVQEAIILEENEKSEYIKPSDIPGQTGTMKGKMKRVDLKPGVERQNIWGDGE